MQLDESSLRLSLAQKPRDFRMDPLGETLRLAASPLQVTATCRLHADASLARPTPSNYSVRPSPRTAPWKLGFMQVQILETLWVYYRGAQPEHGCVLNDFSAYRREKICRDYDPSTGTVWYEGSDNIYDCYGVPDVTAPAPWTVEFYFGDNPRHDVPARVLNPETRISNYLHEVRWSTAFVTTLTEQTSPGFYVHRRHFFWSSVWHFQAMSPTPQVQNALFKPMPGTGFWISEFRRGGPRDSRYLAVLNNPAITPSANDIVGATAPSKSVASSWQRFPLMEQRDQLFV